MADKKKIKELATRRNNVTLVEIKWVVDRLAEIGYRASQRGATHGILFGAGNTRFMVNVHNPGGKQVKRYSVDDFLNAMSELGLYED